MKRCPVCHAGTFDDATTCFGCLFQFSEQSAVLPSDGISRIDRNVIIPVPNKQDKSNDGISLKQGDSGFFRVPSISQSSLLRLGESAEGVEGDMEEKHCPLKKEYEAQKDLFESNASSAMRSEITIRLRISADGISICEEPRRGSHAREEKAESIVSRGTVPA